MVLQFTDSNFEDEVLNSDKPVLVDFYADWCGPCKMMSPIIDEIEKELGDSIKVGKVNSDDNFELVSKYEIMSIPTIIIIKNKVIEKTFIGVTPKEEILEFLK